MTPDAAYPGLLGLHAWVEEDEAGTKWCDLGRVIGWQGDYVYVLDSSGLVDMRGVRTVRFVPEGYVLFRATPGEKVEINRPRPPPRSTPGGGA